jgi:integrase
MKVKNVIPRHGGFYTSYYPVKGGKRKWVNLHTKDLAEAIGRAAEVHGKKHAEQGSIKTSLEWSVAQTTRSTTRTAYKSVAKILCASLGENRSIQAVSESEAKALYEKWDKEHGKGTAQSYARTASALWGKLLKEGKVHRNPWNAKNIKRIKIKRKGGKDFLTKAQRDKMIETATEHLKTILMLGFFAGLRRREIVEVRRDWIDFKSGKNGMLTVRRATHKRLRKGEKPFEIKDSEERMIPMHPRLKDHLKEVTKGLEPLDFVVLPKCKFGKSEYRYDFRAPFEDLVKKLKLHGTGAHTMRRTFASLLIQSGKSLTKVAMWLGDEEKTVRDAYVHLDPEDEDILAL